MTLTSDAALARLQILGNNVDSSNLAGHRAQFKVTVNDGTRAVTSVAIATDALTSVVLTLEGDPLASGDEVSVDLHQVQQCGIPSQVQHRI